jgi:hypothetical protein
VRVQVSDMGNLVEPLVGVQTSLSSTELTSVKHEKP